jgi:Matrixin
MRRVPGLLLALAAIAAIIASHPKAYSLSGHYWGRTSVNYYVNPANNDMSQQSAIASIQNAAANWSEQSTANVKLVYAGTTSGTSVTNNGKNEVFFRNTSSGSTMGVTYYWYGSDGHLLDADTLFYDGGFKFFPGSSGCSSGEYLEDVATHEFGHFVGLNHSAYSSATMYPSLSTYCSQAWRSLYSDDVSAIQKAYGVITSATTTLKPGTPTVFKPANGATGVTSSTYGMYVRWYAATGTTSYDVYFGTTSSPPKIATVIPPAGASATYSGTFYKSVSWGSKKTYYWRVVAKNVAGSTSSAVWKFTTG